MGVLGSVSVWRANETARYQIPAAVYIALVIYPRAWPSDPRCVREDGLTSLRSLPSGPVALCRPTCAGGNMQETRVSGRTWSTLLYAKFIL